MTALTKSDWIKNTIVILMDGLPGYEYSTADTLVETYLANVAGGWVPDVNGDTDGVGSPSNLNTPDQAAAALITTAFSLVNTLSATFTLNVTIKDIGAFATGTNQTDIFAALQTNIQNRVNAQFDDDIHLNSIDFSGVSLSLRTGGAMTTGQRVSINSEITGSANLMDPAAIATAFVRNAYGLNNTWMAKKLYNRANYPIVIFVGKYTSTSYATEDVSFVSGPNTITYPGYVVYLDPVSFKVQTCLTSPLSVTT